MQFSVNLCEPGAEPRAGAAHARGLGVLVKRPFAGLPWRSASPPDDPPHAEYWRRFQVLRASLAPDDWAALALRFAAHAPGVGACLVGGTNLAHLARNVATVEQGPLRTDELAAIAAVHAGRHWPGVI